MLRLVDIGHKLNLLKLAQFAVHASKFCSGGPDQSVTFLQACVVKIEEMKLGRAALEPILFIRMHIAQIKIESGLAAGSPTGSALIQEAKVMVEKGKEELAKLSDVDPSVSATTHYVSSLYFRAVSDYAEFYRSSLMYLSFVSSDSLPDDFKRTMAIDISLSALLGEHVYTFGQLLQHPIASSLDGTPHRWLHEMLHVFNDGDLHKYDELCVKYGAQLNSQPALVQHERRLREKITLMSLIEMVSSLPAESRRIRLVDISTRTKLNADGVEMLLMKALSLHLIEGSIDQVEGVVEVSWVQSRILTPTQVQGLKERLDQWISKVQSASMTLEQETIGVVEASA